MLLKCGLIFKYFIQHDNKRPRLLNTSAMFLDLFRDKAAAVGVSDEEFERSFKQVDGAELQFLTPGFSHEFVRLVCFLL